jgi:hypothetical protein
MTTLPEPVLHGLHGHLFLSQGIHGQHGGVGGLERCDAGDAVRNGRGADAALVGPRFLAAEPLYGSTQFSTFNRGTAVRSLSPLTTIVFPKLRAMAAINMSIFPMRLPLRVRSAAICP